MWVPPEPEQLRRICEFEDLAPLVDADLTGFGWVILQRHGRRPLALLARPLLRANNKCAGVAVWSELTLYETAASRFAATLYHAAPTDDAPPWRDAWLCKDTNALRSELCRRAPMFALQEPVPGMTLKPCQISKFWQHHAAWTGLLAAMFGVPLAVRGRV